MVMSNKERFLAILKNCPKEIWEEFHSIFGPDDWVAAVLDFPESHALLLEKMTNRESIDVWLKCDDLVRKGQSELARQDIIDAYAVFLYDNQGKPLTEYRIKEGVDGLDLAKRIREVKLKKLLG